MKLIGADTIDFETDDTGYTVLHGNWSPAVARPRRTIVVAPPVEDVEETFQAEVFEAGGESVVVKAHNLAELLRDIEAFADGDGAAVVIEENGKQALCTSLVDDSFALPPSYHANDKSINPVQIGFRRRGYWIDPTVESSPLSVSAENPAVQSVTFLSAAQIRGRHPVDIAINCDTATNSPTLPDCVLLVGGADTITLDRATNTIGNNITNVTETTAVGNTLKRWSPTAAGQTVRVYRDNNGFTADLHDVLVIATIKTTGSFAARAFADDAFDQLHYDRWRTLPVGGNPQPIIIGRVSSSNPLDNVGLEIMSGDDGTQIDINAIALLRISVESYALQIDPVQTGRFSGDFYLWVEQQPLISLSPRISVEATGNEPAASWRGNAHIYLSGDTVQTLLLGCTDANWQLRKSSAAANVQMQAFRRFAYLVP